MSLPKHAAKRDRNEGIIVRALLSAGASVQRLSVENFPDLAVGYNLQNFLLEVKVPGEGIVSEGQAILHRDWRGLPPRVIRWPSEALATVGVDPDIAEKIVADLKATGDPYAG